MKLYLVGRITDPIPSFIEGVTYIRDRDRSFIIVTSHNIHTYIHFKNKCSHFDPALWAY